MLHTAAHSDLPFPRSPAATPPGNAEKHYGVALALVVRFRNDVRVAGFGVGWDQRAASRPTNRRCWWAVLASSLVPPYEPIPDIICEMDHLVATSVNTPAGGIKIRKPFADRCLRLDLVALAYMPASGHFSPEKPFGMVANISRMCYDNDIQHRWPLTAAIQAKYTRQRCRFDRLGRLSRSRKSLKPNSSIPPFHSRIRAQRIRPGSCCPLFLRRSPSRALSESPSV